MSDDYNIKISELNPPPTPPITEDFFPLVHSASMTTYRASIQDIGCLITHSIYADTASYLKDYAPTVSASWASASISASYAKTASYTISASHAKMADSASYPSQLFQISCSWASASVSASHANMADNVNLSGIPYTFPFWMTNGANANLAQNSPLSILPESSDWGSSLVLIDSASTMLRGNASYPPSNYTCIGCSTASNQIFGGAYDGHSPSGLTSVWPITSQTFVGTDQRLFQYDTSSINGTYFSGSAGDGTTSGSWVSIGTGPGAISSSFNGKWVRIISQGCSVATGQPAAHAAIGEVTFPNQDMGGLLRLAISSDVNYIPGIGYGSNIQHIIYMRVSVGAWATQPQAQVISTNAYNGTLVQAARLQHSCGGIDPWWSLDLLINGLSNADAHFSMYLQSWGDVRLLTTPNWGPWPFESTSSNDITRDNSQLIFPIAPGNYTVINNNYGVSGNYTSLPYYLQGMPVVITPTSNKMTQSYSSANPYALQVDGPINTADAYYCQSNRGITTTVTYGTTNLYFSGGILIGKNPPDSYTPATAPCLGPWQTSGIAHYNGAGAMYQDATYQIGQGTGLIQFYYNSYSGNPAGYYCYARFQLIYQSNVVWDSDWRGGLFGQTIITPNADSTFDLSQSLAGWAGKSTWCPTIPNSLVANGPTPTYLLTQPSVPTAVYNKTDTVGSTITVRSIAIANGPQGGLFNYTMSCPGGTFPPPPIYVPPTTATIMVVYVMSNPGWGYDISFNLSINLNGNLIGGYNGNEGYAWSNALYGSTTSVPTSSLTTFVGGQCNAYTQFNPSYIISGTNTLTLQGVTSVNGTVRVFKASLNVNTGGITLLSTLINASFIGVNSIPLTYTFNFNG